MPHTLRRILTVTVAIFLLFAIIATFAIIFFPTEKIRARVELEVSSALAMPVTIADVGLSFFGIPSLKVSGITIGDESNIEEPQLSMKSARVRVNLLKLFRREIEITLIELIEPVVTVVILEEENQEISPDMESDAAEVSGPPNIPFPLSLKMLRVKNASLLMDDRTGDGMKITVSDIDVRMGFSLSRDLTELISDASITVGDISLDGNEAQPIDGVTLTFDFSFNGDIREGAFSLLDGELRVNDIPLSVTAGVTNWSQLSFALSSGSLDVGDLIAAAPDSLLPERDKLKAEGSVSFHVEGTLDSAALIPEPKFTGALDAKISTLSFEGLPKSVEDITAKLSFTEREIGITELSANIGASSVQVTGRAVDYQSSPWVAVKAVGDINLIDIGEAVPLPEGMTFAGRIAFDTEVQGKPEELATFKAEGGIKLYAVTATVPESLRNPAKIDGSITVLPEALRVDDISITSGKSDFAFKGRLTNYMALAGFGEGKSRFNGILSSRNIDISNLLVMPEEEESESAEPTKPWDLEESIKVLPIPPNMTGELKINLNTVRYGRLKSDSVKGRLVFGEGVAGLKDLRIAAYAGTLTGATSLDFTDFENITYGGAFKLNALESAGFLADFLNGDEIFRGKLSSSLNFSGAGLDSISMLDNLKASGNMAFLNGQVVNLGLMKKLGDYLKFLDFETLDFESITNSFKVEDRKFITPDMAIVTQYGDIRMDGFTSFDTALDYDITLDLNRKTSAKALKVLSSLTKYIEAKPERLELKVRTTGSLLSPKFSLDSSAAEDVLKDELKKQLSKEVDNLLDSKDVNELKEKGKKLLKKLFR